MGVCDCLSAVSRRPLTAEARISACRVCGGQTGVGTGFYLSSSAFGCYRGSIPGGDERIFPLAPVFRPAVGSSQPTVQWVLLGDELASGD
jgi:hypothetical protein